jgi:hypothetical protein
MPLFSARSLLRPRQRDVVVSRRLQAAAVAKAQSSPTGRRLHGTTSVSAFVSRLLGGVGIGQLIYPLVLSFVCTLTLALLVLSPQTLVHADNTHDQSASGGSHSARPYESALNALIEQYNAVVPLWNVSSSTARGANTFFGNQLFSLAQALELEEFLNFILVIGAESAGKSTYLMIQLQKLFLLTKSSTATRCRTMVLSQFDSSVSKDELMADFEYHNDNLDIHHDRKNISIDELFTVYGNTFSGPKWTEKDDDGIDVQKFDCDNLARITLRHSGNHAGFSFIDHPGIRNSDGSEETLRCSNSSLQGTAVGKNSNSAVLVCQSMKDRSKLDDQPWHSLRHELAKHDVYIALTHPDSMGLEEVAEIILANQTGQSTSAVSVTPLQIFEAVKEDARRKIFEKTHIDPVGIYFAPGSTERYDTLKDLPTAVDRFARFNQSATNIINGIVQDYTNPSKWSQYNISLIVPANSSQVLRDMLNWDHLYTQFQRMQEQSYSRLALETRKKLMALRKNAQRQFEELDDSDPEALSSMISTLFGDIGKYYQIDLNDGTFRDDAMEKADRNLEWASYTLKEEDDYVELCTGARDAFPPESFRGHNYSMEFEDIKNSILQHHGEGGKFSLSTVIHSINNRWSVQIILAEAKVPSAEEALAEAAELTKTNVPNVHDQLAVRVQRSFKELFEDQDAGFSTLALRVALAFTRQAQRIVDILFKAGKIPVDITDQRIGIMEKLKTKDKIPPDVKDSALKFVKDSATSGEESKSVAEVYSSLKDEREQGPDQTHELIDDIIGALHHVYAYSTYNSLYTQLRHQAHQMSHLTKEAPLMFSLASSMIHQSSSWTSRYNEVNPTSDFVQMLSNFNDSAPKHDLLRDISADALKAAAKSLQIPYQTRLQRAFFLVWVQELNQSPDILLPPPFGTHTGDDFVASFNYSFNRHVSVRILRTLLHTSEVIHDAQSMFDSGDFVDRIIQKLHDGFLSGLLGYGEHYAAHKRPLSKRYQLDPDQVIRQLYLNRKAFECKSSVNLSAASLAVSKSELFWAFADKHHDLCSKSESKSAVVSDEIERLYKHWQTSQADMTRSQYEFDSAAPDLPRTSTGKKLLTAHLMSLLVPHRYNTAALAKQRRSRKSSLKDHIHKLDAGIESMRNFITALKRDDIDAHAPPPVDLFPPLKNP